jgi:hypothetical protein
VPWPNARHTLSWEFNDSLRVAGRVHALVMVERPHATGAYFSSLRHRVYDERNSLRPRRALLMSFTLAGRDVAA